MTKVLLSYPVVNVDFSSKTLGRFMVRYFPNQSLLEWPDDNNTFGRPGLSVKDLQSPNPAMLQRDLAVRIKLAESGFSFQDICTLDSMDLADTPLTGAVRDTLESRQRDRFDRKVSAHDEAREPASETDGEDMFRPIEEEPDERLMNVTPAPQPQAMPPVVGPAEETTQSKPISIINSRGME